MYINIFIILMIIFIQNTNYCILNNKDVEHDYLLDEAY